MTDELWAECTHLFKGDAWGNWTKIDADLILALDSFCSYHDLVPLVTSGTQGVHSENSKHYKGQAIDVMFRNVPRQELPLFYEAARERKEFTGLGIYSEWRLHKGGKPIGGMHFERAPEDLNLGRKRLWVRTADGDFKPDDWVFKKYFF